MGEDPQGIILTKAQKRQRDRRNLVIAGVVLGFVVLVYLVTVARMSANMG